MFNLQIERNKNTFKPLETITECLREIYHTESQETDYIYNVYKRKLVSVEIIEVNT